VCPGDRRPEFILEAVACATLDAIIKLENDASKLNDGTHAGGSQAAARDAHLRTSPRADPDQDARAGHASLGSTKNRLVCRRGMEYGQAMYKKFPWSGLYIKLVLCVTLLAYPREARADFTAIVAFLSTSAEVSAITKVVSVTGSILGFFGDKKLQRTQNQILAELQVIKDQNNQALAKLDDIMQALDKLPGVLRQVVREELKKENRTIKTAALDSHMVRFVELRAAELVDPTVLKKSSDEFRGVLSGMKTLSRELMSTNAYGFTCFPIIGRAMLVEFWASRSFNEPAALRQQAGIAYLAYFNAALSPDVEGSIQQYFLSIVNLSYRIRESLIAADRKLQNGNSSIVETGVILSDQNCIRQLADVMHTIEGDRYRGYRLHVQHVNHRQEGSCPVGNDPSDRTNGSERFSMSTLTGFPYVDLSPGSLPPIPEWARIDIGSLSMASKVEYLNLLQRALGKSREWERFLRIARDEMRTFRDIANAEIERTREIIEASKTIEGLE